MSTYAGPELAKAFRTVRNNTIKIAEDIPEDKYGFRATPETRTIAQTLIHIANAPRFNYYLHAEAKLTSLEGFDFMSFMAPIRAEEEQSFTKDEILKKLREGEEKVASWMEGLTPEFLAQTVSFPSPIQPGERSRFDMILGIKEHEMHHRAQLMVLQRMVGVVPHLTREAQARMARMQEQSAAKG